MKSLMKPAMRAVPAVQVQVTLPMQGVLQDVKHAFVGLCIHAGQQVLAQMMEQDRQALCGAKGVPDPKRRAVRGGATRSSVVLGGQRIGIKRPRVRAVDAGELALPSFIWAAGTDPLDAATTAAIAAGVSTRRYASTQQELAAPQRSGSTSKSAVSRRFVALSQVQLDQWLKRRLDGLDLPVVMIDGIHFGDRVVLVALGIDSQGNKHVLGLREGSTEATRVVHSLLSDLIDRGLHAQRMRLWVIDGGKALRKAIVECFGATALIQRCQEHKRRNVIEHLPKELHVSVNQSMRQAWECKNVALAKRQLLRLAASMQTSHPGAAASLKEGLDETLTVQGLGVSGELYRVLRTTNPIENLNGSIARYSRNVKRWKDGLMTLRWVASALTDAAGRFRRVKGRGELELLLAALQQRAPKDIEDANLKAA